MTGRTGTATDQTVGNAVTKPDSRPNGRSVFLKMMDAAYTWWPSRVAVELAAILGCEVRSAERYLAGQRTPDADALIALIKSEHGVQVIGLVAAEMPPQRRAAFWKELARAARRAELLEERDRLDRELRQVSG